MTMMTKTFIWCTLATALAVQSAVAFSVPATTFRSRHTTLIRSEAFDAYEKGSSISQLAFKDINPGEGEGAADGDVLQVSYVGVIMDGRRKFADTKDLIFQIGDGKTMPGFEKGMIGAKEGTRRLLRIPPSDAFGNKEVGRGATAIPANSDLEFDIEVTRVARGAIQGKLAMFGETRALVLVACFAVAAGAPAIESFGRSLLQSMQ
jgi:FKBP-type peptidyl-prolyl cis-trans isomerase